MNHSLVARNRDHEPARKASRLTTGFTGTPSGSHYGFMDPRTVSLELRDYLKVIPSQPPSMNTYADK